MHIVEKYIFVDDHGNEYPLQCTTQRDVNTLGTYKFYKGLDIDNEMRRIVDTELLAELELHGYFKKKPWWRFW